MDRKKFLTSALTLGAASLFFKKKGMALTPPKTPSISVNSDIRLFGAKGDGKHNDSKAFKQALKETGSVYIPNENGLVFLLGDIELKDTRVWGGGRIKKTGQFLFKLHSNTTIGEMQFMSTGPFKNGYSELKIADGANNVRIINCSFIGTGYSCIDADHNGEDDSSLKFKKRASNIFIQGCLFKGNYSRHLYLHSLEDIMIDTNIFDGPHFDAIRLRQNIVKCHIKNNHFNNIGTKKSTDTQDAIDAYWGGKELIITSNIVDKCAKHAFDIKGIEPTGKYKVQNVIVMKNIIKNTEYAAIYLSSGAKVKNSDNTISEILVSENIIKFCNQKKENLNEGAIFVMNGVKNLHILNNQIIQNYSHGIVLGNFNSNTTQNGNYKLSGNLCINNGIPGKNGAAGVYAHPIKNMIINYNNCISDSKEKNNHQDYGFFLGGKIVEVEKITIADNTFKGNKKPYLIDGALLSSQKNKVIIRDN